MGCTSDYQADFFNNIAAIAVVLMFTKVVMHRTRRGSRRSACVVWLHVATLVSAGAAIWISLSATDVCKTASGVHVAAWIFLGLTALLLLVDVIIEDVIVALS